MEFSLNLLGWALDFSLEPDKGDDDKKPPLPGALSADTDRDGEPFETNAKRIGF